MKLGIYLATQFTSAQNVAREIPNLVEQVRVAREHGFSSVWAAHHLLTAPLQMLQPIPLLSYLMPEARGMMIGPNILILPLEHPVHVAEEAATLDHLSGGNYVLGVGLGYRDDEFRAIGTPKKGSTRRFVESIEVIRKLWNEETVTHNGEFFRLDGASIGLRPVRAGGPPIWIAAVVDKAVRRAAELGDGWLITFYPTLEALGEQMKIYREALDASGRLVPVEMPICRECHIGPDRRRALEECGDSLRLKYAAYASWGQDRILSEADRFDQPLKEFVRDRFLIGERGFVRDEMQRYREALSVNHFIMRMQWPGLTHRRVLANIENLAAAAAEMT